MSATGISKEIETAGQLEELRQEVRIAAEELLSAANMKPGQILVVGCSSSEIASHKIGSYSSAEIGKARIEVRTGTATGRRCIPMKVSPISMPACA